MPFSIQLFSALKKEGMDELALVLGDWLHLTPSDKHHLSPSDTDIFGENE
ncbi:GTP-binding protein EngB [Moraxella catarrhalis]|nr:GTP-binding protein EngB [Moraxella catarrhalis]